MLANESMHSKIKELAEEQTMANDQEDIRRKKQQK